MLWIHSEEYLIQRYWKPPENNLRTPWNCSEIHLKFHSDKACSVYKQVVSYALQINSLCIVLFHFGTADSASMPSSWYGCVRCHNALYCDIHAVSATSSLRYWKQGCVLGSNGVIGHLEGLLIVVSCLHFTMISHLHHQLCGVRGQCIALHSLPVSNYCHSHL